MNLRMIFNSFLFCFALYFHSNYVFAESFSMEETVREIKAITDFQAQKTKANGGILRQEFNINFIETGCSAVYTEKYLRDDDVIRLKQSKFILTDLDISKIHQKLVGISLRTKDDKLTISETDIHFASHPWYLDMSEASQVSNFEHLVGNCDDYRCVNDNKWDGLVIYAKRDDDSWFESLSTFFRDIVMACEERL